MSKLYIVIGGSESGHSDFAALLAARQVADRWIDSEQLLVGAPTVTAQMRIAAAAGQVKLLLDESNDVAFSIPLAGAAIIEPFAVSFRESGHKVAIINFNDLGVMERLSRDLQQQVDDLMDMVLMASQAEGERMREQE